MSRRTDVTTDINGSLLFQRMSVFTPGHFTDLTGEAEEEAGWPPAHQNIYVPATADYHENCACQKEKEIFPVFQDNRVFVILLLKVVQIYLLNH